MLKREEKIITICVHLNSVNRGRGGIVLYGTRRWNLYYRDVKHKKTCISAGKGKFEEVSKASPSSWDRLRRATLVLQPGDTENSVKQIIRKHRAGFIRKYGVGDGLILAKRMVVRT